MEGFFTSQKGRYMHSYYIYIVSNTSRMLYVGLTNDIEKMLLKHREMRMGNYKGNFAYNKLVYVEEIRDVNKAIKREIELRTSTRLEKIQLLEITNPNWDCLSEYWMEKV